ncbi:pyrophosphohydrolase domain-containing protein [Thalassobacillus hwangdonensis]|uniref:Phosphoribosyl-ATP pyrophosphohydrolase n=1 Tax=Thalassobacillus hwangdonensis TaxID=546108 RepID=A0ABW3KUP5_9BACI
MSKQHRLVRDNVPNILKGLGKTIKTRELNGIEYRASLKKKLEEEVEEYLNASDNRQALTELADMLEVIYALSYSHGASIEELYHTREHRRKEKGGFKKRTLLIDIKD